MLFDMKKYFSTGKQLFEASLECDFSDRDFYGAAVDVPVRGRFTCTRDGEDLLLTISAETTVHGRCARCLDSVSQPCVADTEWIVKERDLDDPDFELPLGEKGKLDVDEWLYQEILFQVPPVLLCSADCLGLCPDCGKKVADCSCHKVVSSAPADARLSILQSLLN